MCETTVKPDCFWLLPYFWGIRVQSVECILKNKWKQYYNIIPTLYSSMVKIWSFLFKNFRLWFFLSKERRCLAAVYFRDKHRITMIYYQSYMQHCKELNLTLNGFYHLGILKPSSHIWTRGGAVIRALWNLFARFRVFWIQDLFKFKQILSQERVCNHVVVYCI